MGRESISWTVEDRHRRLVEAPQPEPPVVLPDAGDHVVAGAALGARQVEVVHEPAVVVVRLHADRPRGLGWSASGIRVTALRSTIGAVPSRSTRPSTGLATATQIRPSLPRLMLSG